MTTDCGETSLTGVWQGLYSYSDVGEQIPFTATLIEFGNSFSGSTHETAMVGPRSRQTLRAMVDGDRDGPGARFSKTYDGSAGWTHTVFYDGAVNADGDEIEGHWSVPGGMAGRFLMIRPARKRMSVERVIFEEV